MEVEAVFRADPETDREPLEVHGEVQVGINIEAQTGESAREVEGQQREVVAAAEHEGDVGLAVFGVEVHRDVGLRARPRSRSGFLLSTS